MDYLTSIATIVALLFASAFFSGGELAMMALNEINLETRARKGERLSILQKRLRSRPQRFLSTILIGNNVANVALATYAAALTHRHLVPLPQFTEQSALALSATLMTGLILIFSELLPKTLAAINTQQVANWVTIPLYVANILMTPLNWLIEKLVLPMIYAITGGRKADTTLLGREELATAMALAHHGGELHTSDLAVALEALDLSRHILADVMTPRVDLVAVAETDSIDAAVDTMLDTGFSRLPVYVGDLDEITGVALMKDMVRALRRNGEPGRQVRDEARRVAHFPVTKSVVEALSDMRRDRLLMAVVIDEHGGTAGIVTLEDIIEELVGEISDESDIGGSDDIISREGSTIVVSGRARLDQVHELSGDRLGELEATTIGGMVMELLGRPAVVGDSVKVEGARVTVIKALRNRIKLLRIDLD